MTDPALTQPHPYLWLIQLSHTLTPYLRLNPALTHPHPLFMTDAAVTQPHPLFMADPALTHSPLIYS